MLSSISNAFINLTSSGELTLGQASAPATFLQLRLQLHSPPQWLQQMINLLNGYILRSIFINLTTTTSYKRVWDNMQKETPKGDDVNYFNVEFKKYRDIVTLTMYDNLESVPSVQLWPLKKD